MPARHLVIGLDGADVDLLDAIGPARTPNLAALRKEGAWARVRTPLPHATLPSWTTFLTGLDPGSHGVFDFTLRRGAHVDFVAGTVREAPTVAARLDRLGKRCACLFFPGTWPPERLAHGVFVSGWDSPVAFEADRSFVWPPALHDELTARFGPLRFDDADEMDAERPGWHAALGDRLVARITQKLALAQHLLGPEEWDLFLVYFGESDTAAHHLVSLFDPRSVRRPAEVTEREREGLPRVYAALDRAVGALRTAAGAGTELTVVSDHGSGPSSDVVVHLNRALEAAGLLAHHPPSLPGRLTAALRGPAVAALPPRARDRIFRAAGRVLPGWLESRARFGAIDLRRARAFSEELNYFPSIVLSIEGREPFGTVPLADREPLIREVEAALAALRDPDTGRPIVRAVHRRETLYAGAWVERAPDLVLELARRDDGSTYNVAPSRGPGPLVTRLAPVDHLGRKGRSLPGSHRPRGLFVAAGPSVRAVGEIDAHLVDVTATLLERMGVAPPDELPGRVLREILGRRSSAAVPLPPAEVERGRADLSETEARLRALGYVE